MVVYTFVCCACKKEMKDFVILSGTKHSKCPKSDGEVQPYWKIEDIYIEGYDPPPTATPRSA